jgi:hypothetical protein
MQIKSIGISPLEALSFRTQWSRAQHKGLLSGLPAQPSAVLSAELMHKIADFRSLSPNVLNSYLQRGEQALQGGDQTHTTEFNREAMQKESAEAIRMLKEAKGFYPQSNIAATILPTVDLEA